MPSLQTRRDFLRTGALALGATVCGQEKAEAARAQDFSFVVITDLHYRDQRCGPWAQRVAAQIRRMKPRPAFVVLDGDLTEDGTAEQLGAVREILRPLPMPVHSLLGNHDYSLDGRRTAFEQLHGTQLNRRLDFRGYQFLMLDTTERRNVFHISIPDETIDWVKRERAGLSTERPTIIITHFPLGTNWLRPRNADALLWELRGFPLQTSLSGHWHGWSDRLEGGTRFLTGRCCSWWRTNHDGSPLKGYTLCRARNGQVRQEFVAVA